MSIEQTKPLSPVDETFLQSAEATGLVNITHPFPDYAEYAPKDGQGPFGPVVPMDGFVADHFGTSSQDAVLLCDPGTDDMLAGFLALDMRSNLNLRMIIPSFGNVGGEQTFKNTLTLVSLTKCFAVSVAKGSQGPIGDANTEDASAEHGEDGLNGATPINTAEVEADKSKITVFNNGVELLTNEIIRRYENDEPALTILNTGTMTDLAHVLQALEEQRPQAISKIRGISLMGCGIDRGEMKADGQFEKWHTNITPHSEFNINKDPMAAKIAFDIIERQAIPALIFPLDLTHQTGVRDTHEGEWLRSKSADRENVVGDFAAQLYHAGNFDVERSGDIYGFAKDDTTRFMHDPNVVTGLDYPQYYGGFKALINVITDGEEAGRTVMEINPNGSIFVAVQASAPEIIRNWQVTLSSFTPKGELTHAPE